MHRRLIAALFVLFLIYSCQNHSNKPQNTISAKTVLLKKAQAKKQLPKKLVPVFGYRFTITGNFDGRNKHEKLTEHFFSGIDHKETNKFYDGLDYDSLVALTVNKKPYTFLSCNDKHVAPLNISSDPNQFGLSFLKNEGDLNGDGADEISYVINYADWSNINWCTIMTYKNHKWKELCTFGIWDWLIPDIPETYEQYGIAGLENKVSVKDSAANKITEQNFNSFQGLIKKLPHNKTRIIYRKDDPISLDTITVDLTKHHKKNY